MRNGWTDVLVWSLDEQRRLVAAPVTRFSIRDEGRVPAPAGIRPRGQGNRAIIRSSRSPAGHRLGELQPSGPARDPAADPPAAWRGPWLVRAPHRAAGSPHRRRLRHQAAAGALHLQRPGEPGLRRGGSSRGVRHLAAPKSRAHMVDVYLPAPAHCTHGQGNPIDYWFRELGIAYRGAHDKRLPDALYAASDGKSASS